MDLVMTTYLIYESGSFSVTSDGHLFNVQVSSHYDDNHFSVAYHNTNYAYSPDVDNEEILNKLKEIAVKLHQEGNWTNNVIEDMNELCNYVVKLSDSYEELIVSMR
jgi:hypothetical protein